MDGFTVIADPNRRAILDCLLVNERDVGELVEELQLSQPLVSKHLRVLRDARLVEARVAGKRRIYRLTEQPMPDVIAWVSHYARFWNERFDRLAKGLEELEAEENSVKSTD